MTGRGVDQILPRPSDPVLYERSVESASTYVELAERAHGPIDRPVDFAYIWGDALAEIDARSPDVRIINLETSVTTSARPVLKGINYRMHPDNAGCLLEAGIDCCELANNHVLDWGVPGLLETIATLRGAGIATVGAGRTRAEAHQPAVLQPSEKGRILVFAFGSTTSGIPRGWEADSGPGIAILNELSPSEAAQCVTDQGRVRQPGDVVVTSIHWGENWGYEIPPNQRSFAHSLIDSGTVDVIHGHSSHHAKGIEVYKGKLILYGCGDFITDYEGIAGHEEYRPELAVAYFVTLEPGSGQLVRLEIVPFRARRLRLEFVAPEDTTWLQDALNREGRELGTGATRTSARGLDLRW